MKNKFRHLNFWIVLGCDIVLLVAAHLCAYSIRFGGQLGPAQWTAIRIVLPGLIGFKLIIFYFVGLYHGMWRYTGLSDLMNIGKASLLTGLGALGGLLLISRFEGLSRSVFLLDAILTFLMIAGFRVVLRLLFTRTAGIDFMLANPLLLNRRKKILIIGAGDAAEQVAREIQANLVLPYLVVGFLDDQSSRIGRRIQEIPVLGSIGDLNEVIGKIHPDELLIAIPSASRDQMSRIVDLCRSSGLPFKTLPALVELISDKPSIKTVRDVSYKDLLGRLPVRLDSSRIEEKIGDKVVLVTGAGGSIGSELCRQILRFKPKFLILMDLSEHNLYQLEMEILHEWDFQDYVTALGKVQDRELLDKIFACYRPEIVFHAAAYKHVPMVEQNPWEGVFNNVFASKRLMEASLRHGVERFILVSTDKAVRPTNVMGATKRVTEIIMQAYCLQRRLGTRFMAVRFGNVLGSSGSVIPLFKHQIELGGPVTVTHPEITRYFMSIEEASQLILQAAAMGEGGEIFLLKMGTPVRIAQMARDLIRLCGKEPDTEIEIKYTGLRPGEKLYEELIIEGEGIVSTAHEKIMVLRSQGIELKFLQNALANLKRFAMMNDADAIKAELKRIIPEYSPSHTNAILPPGIPAEQRISLRVKIATPK